MEPKKMSVGLTITAVIGAVLLYLTVIGGVLYFVVKVVKWAWAG